MSIETTKENIKNFRPWYEALGSNLTNLDEVLKNKPISHYNLSKFSDNLEFINPQYLETTKEYLSQFVDDPKIWFYIMSLNAKIDKLINLNNQENKEVSWEIMQAANNTDYKWKNLKSA